MPSLLADIPPPPSFGGDDAVSVLLPIAIGIALLVLGAWLFRRNRRRDPS